MERKAFLDQEAPPGYIAGIGRGATGFTTRSDIGNARLPPQIRVIGSDDEDNFEDVNENGLLSGNFANKDDEEADAIYKEVDERMRSRNNKRKVPIDEKAIEVSNLTKISNQFVDLKKSLASVTDEQWASLPEVGDLTKRNKRLRKIEQEQQKTYVAPDSLLAGMGSNTESSVNLGALTSERQKLLGSKIDATFDLNADGVDSERYLNGMSNLSQDNEEEIKKMKTILSSFTKADPKKPEGWIARARLEEFNKNFEAAKKVIQQGCTNCPYDEEIWLENVRLNQYDSKYSKIIIAEAVKLNNKSLKLWLKATELESESYNKKRIIRKALESIPRSPELWIKSVELEDDTSDKIKIASKATEIIPADERLWLQLISLQSYDEAKKTLNKARKSLPNNVQIWLTACKLEADNDAESEKLGKLVAKMFKECLQTREEWFQHAISCEDQQLLTLTSLIVNNILSMDDPDYNLWVSDSEKYTTHIYVYRTILNFIVTKYPKKTVIWRKIIELYRKHFTAPELYARFEEIIDTLPQNALFWLMYSKEVWKNGDIQEAKHIIERAFEKLPSNADLWLALIKLEGIEKNFTKVYELFQEAKIKVNTERIWYKYVTFLREQGKTEEAIDAVDEGIRSFSGCYKLYIQKSQILKELNQLGEARDILSTGTKMIPGSVDLWILLSKIDAEIGNITRARSDLDLGILKNPESDKLWVSKLELEKSLKNNSAINGILTKALKDFPHSSELWLFNLGFNNKKSMRKTLYQDALTATGNHVRILIFIGHNFWMDGKLDKSKRWFERAIEADNDFGDAWAWLYKLMLKTNEPQKEIDEFTKRFLDAEPRHGDIWPMVSKDISNLSKSPLEILSLVSSKLLSD